MLMPLPARQLDPQVLTICLQAVSGFLRLRALSVPTLCARILEFKGRGKVRRHSHPHRNSMGPRLSDQR